MDGIGSRPRVCGHSLRCVEQLPSTQILQEWYKVCTEAGTRSVPMARPEKSGSSGIRQSHLWLAPAPAPASGSSGSGGDRRADEGGLSSDDDVDGHPGSGRGRFAWLGEEFEGSG